MSCPPKQYANKPSSDYFVNDVPYKKNELARRMVAHPTGKGQKTI